MPAPESDNERTRWLARLFTTRASNTPFWFVMNHWASRLGGETAYASRIHSARQLGHQFSKTSPAFQESDAIILAGDFNCEPFEAPFEQQKPENTFRAVRERAIVQRDRNQLAYFYNPMWRLLGEAQTLDAPDAAVLRPPGTYRPIKSPGQGYTGGVTLDHLLLSKSLLDRKGAIWFRESTLTVAWDPSKQIRS